MTIVFEDQAYFDKQAYQRDYNKSEDGKASRKKYRHDNSKHTTDAAYLSKKFVAIDGEGLNVTRGRDRGKHLYVMLAISDKEPLVNKAGLGTREILDYLWENLEGSDINIIYGGSYDFNLWLRDLLHDEIKAVYGSTYSSDPLRYHGYGIRWIKGKAFELTRGEGPDKATITINDVISFFQRSFVQACDEYLGEGWVGRDVIIAEKQKRGNFKVEDLDDISAYNQLELLALVDLANELRARLNKVGLRPRRWNSPGAIASALFLREGVKKHRNENLPDKVMEAARYAYAGGRFEMIKYGSVRENVYEYDINSAYPRALLDVPSLIGGEWIHSDTAPRLDADTFGLFRVRFTGMDASIPAPVFVRGDNGTISYPLNAENWIWTPEYKALIKYCEQIEGASFELLESWVYEPATDYKPFGFIQALYDKRQALKAAGDGAHVGIKLALNSMYGKTAQQVGWSEAIGNRPMRVPTYHQLEWAGYVTSWCRAEILKAALLDIDSVVAFETDALFTSKPLPVRTGTALGDWEETVFASLTYVQSGHYYGTVIEKGKEKEVVKCRGIDKGFIKRKNVEKLLGRPEHSRVLEAQLTRFYGAGIALARGLDKYWCKWLTEPKYMQLRPTGKRLHGSCWCTTDELTLGRWHATYCPVSGGISNEYPVEWINPNPLMSELAEFRESENHFDD